MRTEEIIKLLPTQFKRVSQGSSLYTGHYIPKIGTWNKEDGYTKLQSLRDDEVGESLACPIIAVVTSKIGNRDLTLMITATLSTLKSEQERTRGEYTFTKKVYEPTTDTITGVLTIPRYTRPHATFLITSLGKMAFEIDSITDNVDIDVGVIDFYALASAGSKIIYWLGIHQLAEELRDIIRPWIAPPLCSRCTGTGIEPDTVSTDCQQCLGYGYDGYSSIKYVQRKIGMDVGLAREVLTWDENMTQADHDLIKRFINKAWTQKWWVTPTVKEIKRLIRHFYMITDDQIDIVERFHNQEPVWKLFLPLEPNTNAPFGQNTIDDRALLEYIAETITPAGVSVFVGFFKYLDDFEFNLDDFECEGPHYPPNPDTSIDGNYSLWGTPRWAFWNGWQDAVEDFEYNPGIPTHGAYQPIQPTPQIVYECDDVGIVINENTNTGYYPATYSFTSDANGAVPADWVEIAADVQVAAALGGHNKVMQLLNTATAEQTFTAGVQTNGTYEFWINVDDVANQTEVVGKSGATFAIYTYINAGDFSYYDGATHIIVAALVDTWYHVRIDFECGAGAYLGLAADTFYYTINGVRYGPFAFWNVVASLSKIDVKTHANMNAYIDAVGYSWDPEYIPGDNIIEVGTQDTSAFAAQTDRFLNVVVNGDLDEYMRIYLMDGANRATSIRIDSNVLYYLDSKIWNAGSIVSNERHALSFDFDCATDTYDLYFDGVLEASNLAFQQAVTNIDSILVETESGLLNYRVVCNCISICNFIKPPFGEPISRSTFDVILSPGYMISNPHTEILNANDRFRHVCRLRGTGAYFDILYNRTALTGCFEWWTHPSNSVIKNSFYDKYDRELFYVQYDPDDYTFRDGDNDILHLMMPESEAHLRISFQATVGPTGAYCCGTPDLPLSGMYSVYINRVYRGGGQFTGTQGIYHNKFTNVTQGTGHIDALGWDYGTGATGGYVCGDNWQTLWPEGWGLHNEDFIDGEADILEKYFNNDKPIKL